jgi:hypothetical protein
LAEGADRLVAEEATKVSANLYAPLPFAQVDYEKDFPHSLQEFRNLAAQADVLELDGARGNLESPESYLEVGRFVVRNCDVLIAIWDGERANGRGGTADIAQFSAHVGIPIWHIDARGAHRPRFINGATQFRHREKAPAGADAEEALGHYLRQTILPPARPHFRHESFFGAIAEHMRRAIDGDASPLKDFLDERPKTRRLPWRGYAALMSLLAPAPMLPPAEQVVTVEPVEDWWRRLFVVADSYSVAYGERYRSSYVLIALLAVVALSLAAGAGQFSWARHFAAVGVEVVVLVGIAALVLANYARRWHERWIEYRLLAELCRKQAVLAALGRCLPGADVTQLALEGNESDETEDLPDEAWVAWYFTAAMRAAPPLIGSFAVLKPHALSIGRALVQDQRHYHRARRARNRRAGRRLATIGEWFFVLTFGFGLLKLFAAARDAQDFVLLVGIVGAIVSAASAAFVGIRAYSEFSLLARQSTHMLGVLNAASADLDVIGVNQPLASHELGRSLFALTTAMMLDISGWAQLFRVKNVETG